MAKTQKRWIVGTKRDSTSNIFIEYITKPDEALSALCIPYDSTTSVFEAINFARVGITGSPGPSGATGLAAAPQGTTGLQGVQGATGTGKQGLTGMGVPGSTGIAGSTGVAGVTGLIGPSGDTGLGGITGVQGIFGLTGYQGITGSQGLPGSGNTGVAGVTGLQGVIGSTGVGGSTGLSAQALQKMMFNPVSRYSVENSFGREVWVVSSSTVYMGCDWDRSDSTLNIYRTAHGHSVGDRVIVRNTNKDYQVTTIDSTTSNSFSVMTTATDASLGNGACYSMGFTFTHTGNPATGGIVSAPTGDHSDCQLLSMRIRTGIRVGTTYDLVVPASSINGAGQNTSLSDIYIPDFNVRSDADILVGVGATMTTNIIGSYSTFQFGALGNTLSRFIVAHF